MTNRLDSIRKFWFKIDIVIISIIYLCCDLYFSDRTIVNLQIADYFFLLCVLIVWFFSTKSTDLYDEFRPQNFSFQLIVLLKSCLTLSIASIIILFFFFKDHSLSRAFLVTFNLSIFSVLLIFKLIFKKMIDRHRKMGNNQRKIIIIGTGETALSFYEIIMNNKHFGYNVIGFIDEHCPPRLAGKYLGKIGMLDEILEKHKISDVIIALNESCSSEIDQIIEICENKTTRVRIVPNYNKYISKKYSFTTFGDMPIISVKELPLDEIQNRMSKRVADIILSIIALLLISWWLFPIIALIIKATSKGPVFYKQKRWGLNNETITCYKFRSMYTTSSDFDQSGKFQQAKKNDSRITPIGKFIRKTSIDELPQIFNVLIGNMSIVGPRPHAIAHNLELKNTIEGYMQRHLVKPGLTGWAQVNGYRGEAMNIEQMQKRIDYDVWYIDNWSFWTDIQIIIYTGWAMIKGDKNAY